MLEIPLIKYFCYLSKGSTKFFRETVLAVKLCKKASGSSEILSLRSVSFRFLSLFCEFKKRHARIAKIILLDLFSKKYHYYASLPGQGRQQR